MRTIRLLPPALILIAVGVAAQVNVNQVTRSNNATGGVALSRDGKLLAYALNTKDGPAALWVRELATGQDRQIQIPDGPSFSFVFAPDGKSLYFLRRRGPIATLHRYSLIEEKIGQPTEREIAKDAD